MAYTIIAALLIAVVFRNFKLPSHLGVIAFGLLTFYVETGFAWYLILLALTIILKFPYVISNQNLARIGHGIQHLTGRHAADQP